MISVRYKGDFFLTCLLAGRGGDFTEKKDRAIFVEVVVIVFLPLNNSSRETLDKEDRRTEALTNNNGLMFCGILVVRKKSGI